MAITKCSISGSRAGMISALRLWRTNASAKAEAFDYFLDDDFYFWIAPCEFCFGVGHKRLWGPEGWYFFGRRLAFLDSNCVNCALR
jgi:hypothetical protein